MERKVPIPLHEKTQSSTARSTAPDTAAIPRWCDRGSSCRCCTRMAEYYGKIAQQNMAIHYGTVELALAERQAEIADSRGMIIALKKQLEATNAELGFAYKELSLYRQPPK